MERKLLFYALELLLLAGAASALTSISACQNLTTPGETYSLATGLFGNDSTGNCLTISADNITVECNNFTITGTMPIFYYGPYAVYSSNSSGTRIADCVITGYYGAIVVGGDGGAGNGTSIINNVVYGNTNGISVHAYGSGVLVEGNVAHDNDASDFELFYLSDSSLKDNIAYGGSEGFGCNSLTNATIEGNVAHDVPQGFLMQSVYNSAISNNTAYNNQKSFEFGNSGNSTLSGNAAHDASNTAFYLFRTSSFRIENNSAEASLYAFYLDVYSENNTLLSNNASGSQVGITVNQSNGNTLEGNSVAGNSEYGTFAYDSSGTSIVRDHYYNNGGYDFRIALTYSLGPATLGFANVTFDNPSGDLTDSSSLSLSDIAIAPGTSYTIRWTSQPAPLPKETASFGNRYVEISKWGVESPAVAWENSFGDDSGIDIIKSVSQTADGGYIMAGQTSSYGAGNYDAWLVKANSSGGVQWNRTYGGSDADMASEAVQTPDGGYAFVGQTNTLDPNGDVWLVKTDSAGNMQWNRTYGGPYTDTGFSLKRTSDGGYVIAGRTASFSHSPGTYSDLWLIKTDSSGNMEWNSTFFAEAESEGDSVVQAADGGYAIAGYTSYMNSTTDGLLLKADANGSIEWNQTFGGGFNNVFSSVGLSSDGGYILGGTFAAYSGNRDIWLVKTSQNGSTEWEQRFDHGFNDFGGSAEQVHGGYAIVGTTYYFGMNQPTMIKTDGNGSLLWDYEFDFSRSGLADFKETADGGYILAGTTQNPITLDTNAWLVKLNALGPQPVIDSIEWNWGDSSGYNDSRFRLWQYEAGTGWVRVGGTVNTASKTLDVSGLRPGSGYGVLQDDQLASTVELQGANTTNSTDLPRWNGTAAGNLTTQGGNISIANINGTTLTDRWAAFFGDIAGEIFLGDGTDYAYSWNWTPASGGVVCISTNSTLGTFFAAGASGTDIDDGWGFLSTAGDSGNRTFNGTNCSLTFNTNALGNASYAVTGTSGDFRTCAFKTNDPVSQKGELFFCTSIRAAGALWNGGTGNFELMVPTAFGPGTSEVYYFYETLN